MTRKNFRIQSRPEFYRKTFTLPFRSGSYTSITSEKPVKLYRVYGGNADQLGSYCTTTKPSGPLQASLDSALDPAWRNTANHWVEVTLPSGTTYYEGITSNAILKGIGPVGPPTGVLNGGGSQVYLPRGTVPKNWITGKGRF